MQRFTVEAVLDELTAELAERRRQTRERQQAYKALARAILSDEDSEEASAA